MKESDIEVILERAKEKYPEAKPRIISDNGPQFIARDFKEFIRISGMTHVRTSPYYPQAKDYASYCTSLVRPGIIWSVSDLRENLGMPDPAKRSPAIVHAEIWPSLIDWAAQGGSCRDERQVRGVVVAWRDLDSRGALTRWFDTPKGDPAVRTEEGWILGVPA